MNCFTLEKNKSLSCNVNRLPHIIFIIYGTISDDHSEVVLGGIV